MTRSILVLAALIALMILPGGSLAQSAFDLADDVSGLEDLEAAYWNNMTLSGHPVLERTEPSVDYDWGGGSPADVVDEDEFSARWTGYLEVPSGTYRFSATSDDGMRVFLDGALIIDEWYDHEVKTVTVERRLSRGNHLLVVEYYEHLGSAVARLRWAPVDQIQNWQGEYFANKDLAGSPALVRDDDRIDFEWGTGSPAAGLPADRFSVRWTRQVDLAAGTYRFSVTSDDGARLWVNNRLVLDAWRDQPETTHQVDVAVPAGTVPIRLEYFENLGDALIELDWAPAGPIANWRGEYYANKDLAGSPALVRDDAQIQFDWGTGSPAGGIPSDRFSVRWTRQLDFAAGSYRFSVTTDDGARLWVNNRLLVDAWRGQAATTYQADIYLPGGRVPVRLEYFEDQGDAQIRLNWAPAGQVDNWRGEYYANMGLSGSPALVRDDAQIQFKWGTGSPAGGIPADRFSVRWTRSLNLSAGTYRFILVTDDGARLWVNNQLVIDAWRDQPATTYQVDAAMPGGGVPVKLEYYDNLGDAVVGLSWQAAGQAAAWRGEYYANKDLAGSPALVRNDAEIQFKWGTGSPAGGIPKDRFSVRWTRSLNLAAGTYRFTAVADDGVRLWVNNRLLIDAWRDQSATTYQADIQLPGGAVPVKLEYYENLVDATMRLSWAPAAPVKHWRGEYFSNPNLSGAPAMVRDDAQIQFVWGSGSPAPGTIPADHFSVRWTRSLTLDPGNYQFQVTVDDGVRLWVNGQQVINAWRVQAPTTYYATVYVPGGSVPIKMEYFENTMGARAMLSWVRR